MPDEKTGADSLRVYLTGASSDGAAQTDPDLSLGNFRSSTELDFLGKVISNPISNITVDFISGANDPGVGIITSKGVDTLTWTPPGGTEGASVTILNGETKILVGGTDSAKYVRVTRTSAASLAGAASLTLTDIFNNVYDNISSAEASAGIIDYRAIMFKNDSASGITLLKAYIATFGTQQVSDVADLPGAGAGTIETAADFDDWDETGFCRIETSGDVEQEIVYYSSRTSTVLTIPAAGRGLLGTSATAGAATDKIYNVPGIRIGADAPDSQPTGKLENNTPTASEGTVTLDTGASGSVDGITVDGVEVMSGAEAFDTSLDQTATNVAANITANTSVPNYTASAVGAVITITSVTLGDAVNGFVVVSATTTITTTDVNMAGGIGEGTTPAGVVFKSGIRPATGVDIGSVATTNIEGLWVERERPVGTVAFPGALGSILWDFDA